MLTLLSPSKSMVQRPEISSDFTQPIFLDRAETLIRRLHSFSTQDLMDLMSISEKLGELNRQRIQDWQRPFTCANATPAAFAYTGDTYDGLDANCLHSSELISAQSTLRIVSGLYGLLRPLDLIQPYRLEMSRALTTENAKNLVEFWKTSITDELNAHPSSWLINLASKEYSSAVDSKRLNKQLITPRFLDEKNGKQKIISFFAKRARGSMARYIIQNRLTDPKQLQKFDTAGYKHRADLSSDAEPTFFRSEETRLALSD